MPKRSHLGRCAAASAAVAVCALAGSAAAQGSCPPATAQERQLAEGSLTTKVGLVLAEKRCQATDFLKRVFTEEPDPAQVTVEDVFDASRPQHHLQGEYIARQRERAEKEKLRRDREYSEHMHRNMADEAVAAANQREEEARLRGEEITVPFQVFPPREPGGLVVVYQGVDPDNPKTREDVDGTGVILTDKGIEAGIFKRGQLEGYGEEVTENGNYRSGAYMNGRMEGEGIEVGRGRDGQQYAIGGQFSNDAPDGQATVTYENGSSRRQLWRNGTLVAESAIAPRGATPLDAQADAGGNWTGGPFTIVKGSIHTTHDVTTIGGRTYTGTDTVRDGMMRRIFADGTVQYEEWRDGQLLQVGRRGKFDDTVAPQSTPYPTYVPPPSQAQAPASSGSSGGGFRYSSVCARNHSKLQDWIYKAGGIDWGIRVHSDYMRMWAACRGADPKADQEYAENADYLSQYQGRGHRDQFPPATQQFLQELNRAISDPNYSAELGPAKGDRSAMASAPAQPQRPPQPSKPSAPGTWMGQVDVPTPVLPQSFYAQYAGRGVPAATLDQQAKSDAYLQKLQADLNAGGDLITRMRLLTAQLEGMIVIFRQAENVPGARERVEGMIRSRDATIKNCQNMAATPAICTQSIR